MTLKAKVDYPGLTVGSILVLADGRRLVVRILQKKEEE